MVRWRRRWRWRWRRAQASGAHGCIRQACSPGSMRKSSGAHAEMRGMGRCGRWRSSARECEVMRRRGCALTIATGRAAIRLCAHHSSGTHGAHATAVWERTGGAHGVVRAPPRGHRRTTTQQLDGGAREQNNAGRGRALCNKLHCTPPTSSLADDVAGVLPTANTTACLVRRQYIRRR